MSHDEQQWDEELETVTLMDEEGNARDFVVLDMMELGSTKYWLMEPVPPVEADEEGVWILRVSQNEAGEEVLVPVDDEEELERVWQAWQEQGDDD